jgi:hypothetical protein
MPMSDHPRVSAFCVGSSKCGTTTLYDVLAEHPDCCVSVPKETNFFLNDELYRQGLEAYFSTFYQHYNDESVCIDVSPLYSSWKSDLVLKRISCYNQSAKIVYLVRDPISKLESLWKMIYRNNIIGRLRTPSSMMALKGFEPWLEWCQLNDMSKIEEVMYGSKINTILRYFPATSLYVGSVETLESDLSLIMDFLGLSRIPKNIYNSRRSNRAPDMVGALAWLAPFIESSFGHNKVSISIQARLRNHLLKRKIRYNQPELSDHWRDKILQETARDYRRCAYPMEKITSSWQVP